MIPRLIAGSIIALLLGLALYFSHHSKPFEPLIIDAQHPGVWGNYASAVDVPTVPTFVCSPVYIPGPLSGSKAPISET